MPLFKCPACGRQTSDRVSNCIRCGNRTAFFSESAGTGPGYSRRRGALNWFLGICIILTVLYLYYRTDSGFVYTDSASMLPTIRPGDRMAVFGAEDIPERGSVVNFRFQEMGRTVFYIKRVVGLPGETVEIREGRFFRNGRPVYEPYLYEPLMKRDFERTEVPEGHLFVLGDNRNNSLDSADWGFLPAENVLGRVVLVYWPRPRLVE